MMLISVFSMGGIALPYPILAPLFIDYPASDFNQFAGMDRKLLLAFALSAYPLGALIGSAFIGALSDVYGRKFTLSASLALSGLSYVLSALALLWEWYLLFLLARFVTGIFSGNISIARAIAADLHPIIDKTRSFSWTYAAGYVGWFIGPLAGGYLMLLGAYSAFFVAAATLVLSSVLTLLLITETSVPSKRKGSFVKVLFSQNSLGLLRKSFMLKVFAIALVINLGLNAFYEFYPVWLVERFQFTSIDIGHYTALLTFCMVLASSLLLEFIRNRLGKIATISLSLVLAGLLMVSSAELNENQLIVYFVLMGILIALFNGLLPVFMSDRYEQFGQGKLMGLLTITFYLANALMAIIGGIISLLGAHWSLVVGGFILIFGAAFLLIFDRNNSFDEAKLKL